MTSASEIMDGTRDCGKCKHYKKRGEKTNYDRFNEEPIAVYGCELWECKFEPAVDMASNKMTFPDTWEEYERIYGITDTEEVYSVNGVRFIPSFRVKQWLDHMKEVGDGNNN